jgi:quercetin dioxygenase-like cupin family protein
MSTTRYCQTINNELEGHYMTAADSAVDAARNLYSVKNVSTHIISKEVQVREFTLAPGEEVPWHEHSHIIDTCICLKGIAKVQTREPAFSADLKPGENHPIPPNTAHRVSNETQKDCVFLLVQGVGEYDFKLV